MVVSASISVVVVSAGITLHIWMQPMFCCKQHCLHSGHVLGNLMQILNMACNRGCLHCTFPARYNPYASRHYLADIRYLPASGLESNAHVYSTVVCNSIGSICLAACACQKVLASSREAVLSALDKLSGTDLPTYLHPVCCRQVLAPPQTPAEKPTAWAS